MRIVDVDVIAPNFKRKLSGVTSTIIQLLPLQAAQVRIAAFGPGLPTNATLPKISWWQFPGLLRRPRRRRVRIWHARRNVEMVAGIVLRSVLRAPLKLIFTSAAQRRHKRFTRFLIARMDAVIATSKRSGSFLEVPHCVIRHGLDCTRFHPHAASAPTDDSDDATTPGRFVIGCFGRIRPQKGTDLFVEAMMRLLPEHPEWSAVLTGRTTRRHRDFARHLRHNIKQAGLEDRIRFLGEVPDVRPWYRRLALYVAPSRNEGFGLTPLEAMASQTAVVASDAGAYAEMIVDGKTGAVVAAGDGAALSAAIERYLKDPQLADTHGRNARAHVERHFAIENEINALSALYQKLWDAA